MLGYTVYRTVNQLNGMFYIGVHKSTDPNDSYLGSGKRLKYAIKKYGIENFKKEILFVFDTKEEAFSKEKELVTEEVLDSGKCYNLKIGGYGGWDHIPKDHHTRNLEHMSNMSKISKLNNPNGIWKGRKHSQESKQKTSNGIKNGYSAGKRVPTYDVKHTENAKKSIGEKNSLHQTGSKNSQYGTKWKIITDGIQTRKIRRDEEIPNGWVKGFAKRSKYLSLQSLDGLKDNRVV